MCLAKMWNAVCYSIAWKQYSESQPNYANRKVKHEN